MRKAFVRIRDGALLMDVFDVTRGRVSFLEQRKVNHRPSDIGEFILDLPDEVVSFRILSLPVKDENRVRKMVPFEISMLTKKDPEKILYAVESLPDERQLVGFVDRDRAIQMMTRLKEAGIDASKITSSLFLHLLQTGEVQKGAPTEEERRSALESYLRKGGPDFLSPAAVEQRWQLYSRLFHRIVLLFSVVVFFIGVNLFIAYQKETEENHQLRAQLEGLWNEVMPSVKMVAPVHQLKAEMKLLRDSMKELDLPPVVEDLRIVSDSVKGDVKLNQIRIEPERVVLKGVASSLQEVEEVKAHLSASYSSVRVNGVERTVDGMYRFTIQVEERRND